MIDAELEAFADELSDRLRARADRLDVVPDDPSIWATDVAAAGATSTVSVMRPSKRWIVAVAAAVIALVTAGGSALRAQPTTVETASFAASVSVERMVAAGAGESTDEMIVWMEPTASDAEIAGVAAQLDSSDVVDGHRFVDRDETYDEFTAFWADSPEVIAAVEIGELPTSFRIRTDDPLTIVELVGDLPGVLGSNLPGDEAGAAEGDDPAPEVPDAGDADRLFLLPAQGTPLPPSFFFAAPDDVVLDEPLSPPIVVGRRTETGFDQVVSVSLEAAPPLGGIDPSEWNPLEEPITVGDRILERSADGWFEALDDMRWLVVQTAAGSEVVSQVVTATSVDDGRVVVDPDALGELEVLATLPPTVATGQVTIQPMPDPEAPDGAVAGSDLRISSVRADVDLAQLVVFGVFGRAVDMVEVGGNDGWIVRPIDDGVGLGSVLVWLEPSGHIVSVSQSDTTDAELLVIAEGMRVVDRATWIAELSALGGAGLDE